MRRLAPLALCLTLLPACKPPSDDGDDEIVAEPVEQDRFAAEAAEAICAQLFACACGDNLFTDAIEPLPWADEAACVAEKEPELQTMLDDMLADGATFSPECGGEYIAGFERLRCDSAWDYVGGGGSYYQGFLCPLAVREQEVGAACQGDYSGRVNDCGEGKLCSQDSFTCVEIDDLPIAEGRICRVSYIDLPCDEGLSCIYDNTDGEHRCVPPYAIGDACPNYECPGADLTCNYETFVCEAPAGLGDSCEAASCAAGLYCDGGKDFTCQAKFEFGEGCANDTVCAHGADCINNICTPPPPAICSQL